jgi:DNA-binding transcriptional LysR family regulator
MRIVARVPDALSVLTAVAAGIGLGVLSEALTRISVPGVVFRKVMPVSRYSDHAVVYRKNEGAPVIKAFVAKLRARVPAMARAKA